MMISGINIITSADQIYGDLCVKATGVHYSSKSRILNDIGKPLNTKYLSIVGNLINFLQFAHRSLVVQCYLRVDLRVFIYHRWRE